MVVEKERVSLLGVGDLVVPPSAGAATAVVIAEREHMRTARVVSHVGILYRVAQVGWAARRRRRDRSVMTLPAWRGRGSARAALTKAAAFVAGWRWAPEGLVICAREGASSYQKRGWHVANAPVMCEPPRGRGTLPEEVAVVVRCHGDTTWPNGPIDLRGVPW